MNSIESHILRLVGENVSSPDVFTDDDTGMAQIRTSINDAITELCTVTAAYTRPYLLALLEDRLFYRLSSESDYLLYPYEIWDRQRKTKLTQTDPLSLTKFEPMWMQINGPPEKYMILGPGLLGIYMKPSSKGTVLEITMVCVPKEYTADTDPIHLSEKFQNAAAYYGTSEYYASRGDATRAADYLKKYLETAQLMGLHPEQAERQFGYQQYWDRNRANGGNGQ